MHPSEYIPNYDLIAIGEWYKDDFFWRKKSADGSDGKGDLIFNTCYKIFRDKDKSNWAYCALVDCGTELILRQRWPDRMWDSLDAESWIERIIVRSLKHWFSIIVKRYEFRYQGRMTRDPFIAFYLVCVFLDRKQFIEVVDMPCYCYSHTTWRWRRRLIKDERVDYRRRLEWLRAKAIVLSNPEFE